MSGGSSGGSGSAVLQGTTEASAALGLFIHFGSALLFAFALLLAFPLGRAFGVGSGFST